MISVEGLTKTYGRRNAVDHIDFHAERGEIVGFLGPNGAGKTTTMRILSGFMPPTSGKASVGGFDVVEQSLEVRKRVGYLPETVPLYTDMTVHDYLSYMGSLHKVEDVEDRVEDVLEMVNMESRIDSYISSLSKGMRQRIGLAQALIHDPDVLILDEPTIGLDPAQIIEIRNLIREMGAEHTVLLSTHILSEVQQLCDRILVINRGKIVAEGTPKNLEQRLAGAGRVSLQVIGDGDGLADVVRKVPGVQSVLSVEGGSLEFITVPGAESRPAVAKAIVGAGYDLVEIRSVGMSLEQIFLELTTDDDVMRSGKPEKPEKSRTPQGDDEDEDEE
jgi:ABC-2 type transport system ATP-binding protein